MYLFMSHVVRVYLLTTFLITTKVHIVYKLCSQLFLMKKMFLSPILIKVILSDLLVILKSGTLIFVIYCEAFSPEKLFSLVVLNKGGINTMV